MNWISALTPPGVALLVVAVIAVAALVWTVVLFRKLTSPEIDAISGQLSADLERELFKRLWAWLSVVGAMAAAVTIGAWVIISAGFAGEARDAANREARLAVEQQLQQTRGAITQQQNTIAKLQADTNRILDEALRERVEIARIVAAAKERAKSAEEAAKAAELELQKVRDLRAITTSEEAVISNVDPIEVVQALAQNTKFQTAVAATALDPLNGIIVASTRRCIELPGEWTNYEDGEGKFIIGAGAGELRYRGPHRPDGTPNVVSLTPVSFGDQGGAEEHKLLEKEMPSHDHSADGFNLLVTRNGQLVAEHAVSQNIDINARHGQPIRSVGQGEPHNNMPPYIALYFCKKEGG